MTDDGQKIDSLLSSYSLEAGIVDELEITFFGVTIEALHNLHVKDMISITGNSNLCIN